MAKITGLVEKVITAQEGKDVVLRFVLCTEQGNRIPCEMRGKSLVGVLNDGDEISMKGKYSRNRYGVSHPKDITNLSTHSVIRVKKTSLIGRLLAKLFSLTVNLALSVGTGVGSSLLVKELFPEKKSTSVFQSVPRRYPQGNKSGGAEAISDLLTLPVVVGVAVAVIVFIFLIARSTRR